jgi:hypothetical protein
MKAIASLFFLCVVVLSGYAQDPPKSAKAETLGSFGNANVKINYNQPQARGREIMGGLVPYGKVWRTGANEATTVEFDKDVKIEGKDLAAGKYALFTIPGKDEWVVIFNKEVKQWGAYKYEDSKDALRVNVKPGKTSSFVETFTIGTTADAINLQWENTLVPIKVSAK